MQHPIFAPESSWTIPAVFPTFEETETIAIDLETYDPHLMTCGPGWATNRGYIVGIGIATKDWKGYFPIRHEGGGNLDEDVTLRWLRNTLSSSKRKVIFHNALYDVGWLRREGVDVKGQILDTIVAAPLINENRYSYSLDNLGSHYCDEKKDESLLQDAALAFGINPKSQMYKLPSKYVGPYGEQDAALTLKLWDKLKIEIAEQNLDKILDMECRLIPMLLEMRWRGVRVDEEKAETVSKKLSIEEQKIQVEIKRKYGSDVNLWANASLQKIFDKNDLWYPRTEKGMASFQRDWLESHEHELPRLIIRARKLNKARTTFIDKMIKEHCFKGRIHAEAHPMRNDRGGTVSGRFSYSNPNLQQVPARDPEIGSLIRSLFIPEDGCQWGVFDYSQQEPRLTVHYASQMQLAGSKEAVEEYTEKNADFHQIVADMANIPRKQAKTINLGLSYGMGKEKLIKELGLDDTEAENLFQRYHAKVPFIRALQDQCARVAMDRGYIKTFAGRHCRFNLWEDRYKRTMPLPFEEAKERYGDTLKRSYTYKALNRLIQGSAADMTKLAMLGLWEEGIVPHLQVHDEVDISIENTLQGKRIVEIMENCVKLTVPLLVDMEVGPSWGEIKEIKK
jgi:DNA polymerase I-like protein with 3'-5' exonuclease and polymerase domains|tara:strand:+ start:10696 stop:12558 length:1863 start_codon:yes stop_codon:yes gene_type:complete